MRDVVERLRKAGAKKVFVQFPEGLKLRIQDIAKDLEKAGFDVVLSLERCWGGCDIRPNEAKLLGCDAILHIGHSDFGLKSDIRIVYWDYSHDIDPVPALEKEIGKLEKHGSIGLVSSVQFTAAMEKVKRYLESRGKKVFTSKGEKNEGQVLGCRVGAGKAVEDKVDCFLCVSAGKFYPMGLALKTEKPVFNLDVEKGQLYDMNDVKKKMMKVAAWNLAFFNESKKIGLLVSWKSGQMLGDPFKTKRVLERRGKEIFVLAFDELSTDKLEGLKLDFLINFCCPRMGIDDQEKYKIPMLNYSDIPNLE